MYTYGFEFSISTQDDVNAIFREQGISAELTATDKNTFFICPQLCHSLWQYYPQNATPDGEIDTKWIETVTVAKDFLIQKYDITIITADITWHTVNLYRCAKMENHTRTKDVLAS